ncbi:hypothetical protein SAMN06269117_11335 [Balnearium lithotrophicum]|uniref:Uncharacterized protein n=1 Tax=Balnearium lithotrophicum TaxID=223788 RepID=A0A521CJK8_9BACT|nr:hypothetical protein [Balnearium lithotrophicum]SMO59575.1 hypothetical protein SAMN06269117_11335 [Balnearium lithotrophicum]
MKLKELCKYCQWNHKGHCTLGNGNWRALMAEEEVSCEDFEPINLCSSCQRDCKENLPEVRVVDCPNYKQNQV